MGYLILLWHTLSLPYNYFVTVIVPKYEAVSSGANISISTCKVVTI